MLRVIAAATMVLVVAGDVVAVADWPFRTTDEADATRVGGVGGGGGASLWCMDVDRLGGGGGGGGMLGAVTASLEGGGGATLVTDGPGPDLEVGGEGGLAIGGLRTRLIGLCCVSFRQS